MKLAAFPKCYMDELVRDRTMTLFQWIDMAADLPVDGLELYDGTLTSFDDAYLEKVREAHARHKLEMPLLCCSSDFTQPRAEDRRKEVEHEKLMVDITARLGGKFCRVLSGQRRPGVSREEGVRWVVEGIKEVLEYSAAKGIVLTMENHYKDNFWTYPEFAQKQDVFLEIVNQIDSPWFGVQYDPSNAILAGEDPLDLLEKVKHRVVTMHASDRHLKPGHTIEELRAVEDAVGYAAILTHGEVGKGMNNYPHIFRTLREVGFDGWVSIEDGLSGIEEIRASAEFLRPFIDRP
ncbi:MAG: sugar phosphate isomerase/epimerase family protein [Terriglobia bacterium]